MVERVLGSSKASKVGIKLMWLWHQYQKRKMCQVNPQETEEILRVTVIVEAAASSQEDNGG